MSDITKAVFLSYAREDAAAGRRIAEALRSSGLEKCFEEQDGACWGLRKRRYFDSIRHEPRFQALLKKVGLDRPAP